MPVVFFGKRGWICALFFLGVKLIPFWGVQGESKKELSGHVGSLLKTVVKGQEA